MGLHVCEETLVTSGQQVEQLPRLGGVPVLLVAGGGRYEQPGDKQEWKGASGKFAQCLGALRVGTLRFGEPRFDTLALFEEIAADPAELFLDGPQFQPSPLNAMGSERRTVLPCAGRASSQFLKFGLSRRDLGARMVVELLRPLAALEHPHVLLELIDNIESEQVLDRGADQGG